MTIARNDSISRTTNGGEGIHVAGRHNTVVLTNTILVGHSVGITVAAENTARLVATLWGDGEWANGVNTAGVGTVISSTNVAGDPAFVDPDGGDYHVTSTSVAVDRGVDSSVLDDMDGDPRPANMGHDLGADEQPGAVLRLRETARPRYVNTGQRITYTTWITNVGTVRATALVFTDVLPLYQRPVGVATGQGLPCSEGADWGAAVTCPLGDVSAGQTAVVTLTVEATSTQLSPLPYPMLNAVQVRGENALGEISMEVYVHDCHVRVNGALPEYSEVQAGIDAARGGETVMVAGYCSGADDHAGLSQVAYLDRELALQGGWNADFTIRDPDLYPTTLDGQGRRRVLYITGAISPTLSGLRITGGDAAGLAGYTYPWSGWTMDAGGGVYVVTAAVAIGDCRVFGNTAQAGGGLYLDSSAALLRGNTVASNTAVWGGGLYLGSSPATFSENTVSANVAERAGGGLYLYNSGATLNGNTVSTNTTFAGIYGGGGGLYLSYSNAILSGNVVISNTAFNWGGAGGGLFLDKSAATLDSNTISFNTANQGGGLRVAEGDATLDNNIVSGNTADGYCGGLVVDSDAILNSNIISRNTAGAGGGGLCLADSNAKLDGNIIVSNTAGYGGGGGLYVSGGSNATLINAIIAGNRADHCGGGLHVYDASPRLLHTTIVHNSGGDGSGVCVTNFYETSVVALTNTILVSHSIGITVAAGNRVALDSVLWHDTITHTAGRGAVVAVNEHAGDPVFVNPDAGDYHLAPGSAALDRGVDAGVDHDVDGQPHPCGPGYDLGADELCRPALTIAKRASSDSVQAGERLTYTIYVTNTGEAPLHAAITDTLPLHVALGQTSGGTLVLPGGEVGIVWTALVPAPGGVWTETVIVSVEEGYAGPLVNRVAVTTREGATGAARVVVNAARSYLPLVLKNAP
jgi:uncharacterized repeat protein (TIGR01451 family)